VTEPFTLLQDITTYTVHYKPRDSKVALWDCPKVIRDAANGKPPEVRLFKALEVLRDAWPLMLGFGVFFNGLWPTIWGLVPAIAHNPLARLFASIAPLILFPILVAHESRRDYGRDKEIFDAYAANPELFRDEIYKAAVNRLPYLDFAGKHRPVQNCTKVGQFEADVIEVLRKLGIRQETTVANRGRPYLIHQYELTELNWGKWENGDSKNYVMDIAILWPERRIKFDIEVDDPSHKTGTRPLKDRNRDEVLTARGWFTRRLNHKFLADQAKTAKALQDIVGMIYFFAKYANEEPIDLGFKVTARAQNQRFRKKEKVERSERAVIVPTTHGHIGTGK
jgi:very-short-patch-repair endonuclease